MSTNPFARKIYTAMDPTYYRAGQDTSDRVVNPTPFGGGDIKAYINDIEVGNLEAVTWSISTEIVGNYVIGNRDPLSWTKGKRVIVGSMSMQQWTKHALLEEVFALSDLNRKKALTIGQLWSAESAGAALEARRPTNYAVTSANGTTGGVAVSSVNVNPAEDELLTLIQGSNVRGLSRTAFEQQVYQQIEATALDKANELINYPDQLPPFNLTIVGVSEENGATAYCTLFGVQITQETDGKSMNDLNPTVGFSFVCKRVTPWREVISQAAADKFS